MEIKGRFDHFNINVTDLDRSLAFYREALGLHEIKRKEAADGSFVLAYLGDDRTGFRLELTWLRDHAGRAYELGVNYFDTSPAYCQGQSERATGIALKRHPRNKYFIATKLSNFNPETWTRKASIEMFENIAVR